MSSQRQAQKNYEAVQSEVSSTNGSCITVNEAAVRLKLCRRSIERAIATGELRCIKIGRAVRILESDFEAFLNRHLVACGKEVAP